MNLTQFKKISSVILQSENKFFNDQLANYNYEDIIYKCEKLPLKNRLKKIEFLLQAIECGYYLNKEGKLEIVSIRKSELFEKQLFVLITSINNTSSKILFTILYFCPTFW